MIKMFRVALYALVFQCCLVYSEKNVQQLTKYEFQDKKELPDVNVVHFVQEMSASGEIDHEAQAEKHSLQMFKREYEKSASVLRQYDIGLFTVNCKLERVDDYCKQPKVYMQVFIFRDGMELLKIGIESMFDVDSIVSNVLQLALLREVPILQSFEERSQYENQAKGLSNIIFSYQNAIGTPEHRWLVEVAFTHHKKIKFSLATDSVVNKGLPDADQRGAPAVWVLQCKHQSFKKKKPCPAAKYYGKLTLEGITAFVNNLDRDPIIEVKDHNEPDPFMDMGLHTVQVFYDKETSAYIKQETNNLAKTFRGSIGIRMIDVEKVDATKMGLPEDGQVPLLTVQDRTGKRVLMDENDYPDEFIKRHLTGMRAGSSQAAAQEDEFTKAENARHEYLAAVEKQDDEVATAVSQLRKSKSIEMDALLVLTEKTFEEEVRSRELLVVFYYLPFDTLSLGGLYSYINSAETFAEDQPGADVANPFGVLNCYDWPRVCSQNNITSWPTVHIMRKDRPMKKFRGILSPASFKHTVDLYTQPAPIVLESLDEVLGIFEQHINKKMVSTASVVGLADDMTSKSLLTQVADDLHGEIPVYLVIGDLAKKWVEETGASLPSIFVLKQNDDYQPQINKPIESIPAEELVFWIREASRPVLVELTPAQLPALYVQMKPLVIFFTPREATGEKHAMPMDMLGSMAARNNFPNLVFTWMDLNLETTKEILVSYAEEYNEPRLVVVDLSKAEVFIYTMMLDDPTAMLSWIEDVANGNINATKQLAQKDWKPHNPGYDFLKMMDQDQDQEAKPSDYDDQYDDDEEDDIPSYFQPKEEVLKAKDFQADYERNKAEMEGMKTMPNVNKYQEQQQQQHTEL